MTLAIALDLLNSILEFVYYALYVILFADVFLWIIVLIFTAVMGMIWLREAEDVSPSDPNPRKNA